MRSLDDKHEVSGFRLGLLLVCDLSVGFGKGWQVVYSQPCGDSGICVKLRAVELAYQGDAFTHDHFLAVFAFCLGLLHHQQAEPIVMTLMQFS